MRVGILGGTFNPPHNGHERVGEMACEVLDLDELLLVPCREPVHKELADGPGAQARLEMCQAMCIGHDGWQALDWEIMRPTPSYTVETLRQASTSYSGAELFLVIGADSFLSLPGWHQPEGIASLAEVIVIERGSLSDAEKKRVEEAIPGLRCHFLEGMSWEASSTKVRRLFAEGKDVSDHLPQGVAALISERHWYGGADSTKWQ